MLLTLILIFDSYFPSFITIFVTDSYLKPTEDDLLRMAGGTKEMVQATGKAGEELRTVLAQRVSACVLVCFCCLS